MTISVVEDKNQFNKLATHITQSWEWGEFRVKTPNVVSVVRLGSFEGKKLVRVFQVFFHKIPYLSRTIAYVPRSVAPNKTELDEIVKIANEKGSAFIKLEPINDYLPSVYDKRIAPGGPILPQHTIYIDLTLSEEQLLSGMHEKTRYNVRLAQKKGVQIKEENTQAGLEKFIDILVATEKRQGFYAHTPSYYRQLFEVFGPTGMFRILNAYFEEKVIGSIGLFAFNDFLYYPYGGLDYEYRSLMAPQLLHFEAMKLGKKLGLTTYDLWGSYKKVPDESDPWWGFYRLKSGLGGVEVHFPQTVDVILSPIYKMLIAADKARWAVLRAQSVLRGR